MKTEFTKGEWEIEKTNSRFVLNNGSIDIWFGDVTENQVLENEALANAKLIAAAPEMFEALTAFIDNVDNWLKTGEPASPETSKLIYDNAKMAIKKATE